MALFNDPGVYVVQSATPAPLTPVMPERPTAIIGPMYQIVDQEVDTNTGVAVAVDMLEKDPGEREDVVVPYPSLISDESTVDTDSVRVLLHRNDGRAAEITDFINAAAQGVTLPYTDADFVAALGEINDAWGGKTANDNYVGLTGVVVHVQYRAHRSDLVGQVLQAQGARGVLATIGKGVPENPLGLAGLIAATVNGTGMYFVPTPDPMTGADVDQALELLEAMRVYAPVLLSDNPEYQQKVISHVRRMSSDEERQFRVAWTYYPVPTRGDLEANPDSGIDENSTLEQVKAAQKDAVKAYCQSVFEERAIVLYDDFTTTIDGNEVELPGYYLCAAYAALKSQIAPQQGLTNYPVGGVVKELKYGSRYFRPSHLKELSQAGAFVLLQATANAPIRSRFQTTTNVSTNKTKQISLVYARDHYSYTVIDTLENIIGRVNVNEETLETIEMTLSRIHKGFRDSGLINRASIVHLAPSPDNEGRVDAEIEVGFQTPLDIIVITLRF